MLKIDSFKDKHYFSTNTSDTCSYQDLTPKIKPLQFRNSLSNKLDKFLLHRHHTSTYHNVLTKSAIMAAITSDVPPDLAAVLHPSRSSQKHVSFHTPFSSYVHRHPHATPVSEREPQRRVTFLQLPPGQIIKIYQNIFAIHYKNVNYKQFICMRILWTASYLKMTTPYLYSLPFTIRI